MSYTALVTFNRDFGDDANVIGKEQPTPYDLAKQLAVELQEAYDELSIAGQFKVNTIILNGERHSID